MALLPFMADEIDDYFYRKMRALDRMVNEDFCPFLRGRHYLTPRRHSHYDSGAVVKADKNAFHVSLDVQQFAPEELTVKIVNDNSVVVEGKHEEKEDEHGFVSRHFVRRYVLPKGHDAKDVQSNLSSDGILTITAKKRKHDSTEAREIPITLTGPSKKIITNGVGDEKKEESEAKKDDSCEPKAKKSKV